MLFSCLVFTIFIMNRLVCRYMLPYVLLKFKLKSIIPINSVSAKMWSLEFTYIFCSCLIIVRVPSVIQAWIFLHGQNKRLHFIISPTFFYRGHRCWQILFIRSNSKIWSFAVQSANKICFSQIGCSADI